MSQIIEFEIKLAICTRYYDKPLHNDNNVPGKHHAHSNDPLPSFLI